MIHKDKGEAIKIATNRINNNGGKVFKKAKALIMPSLAGIKIWAARDCLVNHGEYVQVDGDGYRIS